MIHEIDFDQIDLTQEPPPPESEPNRQYYFMAKCRQYTKKFFEENGRLPKACVVNYGCQMNARDSEKLTGILQAAGYRITEDEEADLCIYNTCTVRNNANQKVYGRLGVLHGLKRKNPRMKIALCGCMMQEEAVLEKIRKSYPFVDLIFGTHNLYRFAELLYASLSSDERTEEIWEAAGAIVEDLPKVRKYPFKSGINIMFGCNNFCSYCIVPYVRGRERSREPEDILREIETLAADGVLEIMLLGQNVNSYGANLKNPMSFARLLEEAEKIDGIQRIRFMTSHPKDLSDELIQVMKRSEKICRHLHLPLQSGSTRILKAMNRRYTKEQYLELVGKIRSEIPDISITTDIIVGFPGETEEDVEETIDVVRKAEFDNAFTFLYSKRIGTPAASMKDQAPKEAAQRCFDRLLQVVQKTAQRRALLHNGKTASVLVEEANAHDESLMTGRLSNNMLVHFPGDKALIGKIVNVHLDECKGFYYMGTLV